MKISEQEIQNLIAKLPENIRRAVNNFDWAKEIMDIAHAHYIQIDDIEEFHQETLKVILGISPAENFEENVINALHVDKKTAGMIVAEANERIFRELQKRAFSDSNEDDNHHKEIKHADLKNIMDDEGIKLTDESKPQIFHNDLHKEVSELLGTQQTSLKNNSLHKDILDSSQTSLQNSSHSYREPIEESDLRGIRQHSADTSILKTQYQSSPESLLSYNSTIPKMESIEKNQSLDEQLITKVTISQSDTFDISPNEQEVIKEESSFLEHLSKEED